MDLIKYREYSPLSQLRDEINRLFSSVSDGETSAATATWVPPVDIREFADRFELTVDLPGVDPKDVDITLEDDVLTLSGERAGQKTVGKNDREVLVRLERGTGHFHRRFILPDSVDSEQINATGRNGVLEITIRKQAKAQPRRIKVAA